MLPEVRAQGRRGVLGQQGEGGFLVVDLGTADEGGDQE
jgi:hypothetical protein